MVGQQERHPACKKLGGDDLTGILVYACYSSSCHHYLHQRTLAPMKSRMETFLHQLTQDVLGHGMAIKRVFTVLAIIMVTRYLRM